MNDIKHGDKFKRLREDGSLLDINTCDDTHPTFNSFILNKYNNYRKILDNNIEEDYVSFEVAKLLKEKEFDCETDNRYTLMYPNGIQVGIEFHSKDFDNELIKTFIKVKMPTQSLAIKWIRENFNLYLDISYLKTYKWCFQVIDISQLPDIDSGLRKMESLFKSPDEATEAALLYTLKNLIP